MRKIGKSTNTQLREHQLKVLVGLFEKADNQDKLLALLKTVTTPSERQAIAQRAAIICRIHQGKKYFEIESNFGVSSTTITKAIDQYHKNGEDNKLFNLMLEKYKEPEFHYKITPDYKGVKERIIDTPLSQAYKEFNYVPKK